MTDKITIGDPMFESSIQHSVHGDYHSRKGDRLLAQMEGLLNELRTSGLDPSTKRLKVIILRDVRKKLRQCGPYYAEKAGITMNELLLTASSPVPATPKGREFLAGPPKRLKH